MTTDRLVRRLAAVAGLMTVAALVAACGTDQGSASSDIRVIQSVPDSVTEVGVQAGQYLKTYDECLPGVNIDRKVGTAVEQAIAADSADIGIVTSNSLVAAIASGLEGKIIGSSMDGWNQVLIMGPDSTVKSFEDLKPGLKLGITRYGSAGHYASLKLAEDLGWSKGDYQFVTVGTPPSLQAGLKSGLFDGFVWGPDTGEAMEASGDGKVAGELTDLIGPNVQIFYVASDELIEERPDDVKKFMECTYQAVQKLKADRETAVDFFVKDAKKDPKVAEGLVDRDLKYASSDGSVPDEAMAGVLDAVHSTIPELKDMTLGDLQEMYVHWKDL